MKEMATQSYRQALRIWMAAVLVGALLLGVFQPVTTAQAEGGFAYYWSLTFDFDGSADGKLYVAVGYNENGAPQEPVIHSQTFAVSCQRVGNAGVSGGMLKLNGGYLRCDLDLQDALQTAFAACDAIVPGCRLEIEKVESYANLRATAQVLSSSPGEAPIFYHQDVSYGINPQSSTTQITAWLSPHGLIPSTPVVSPSALGVWHSYEAFYGCDGGCDMAYRVGTAQEVVATANAEIPIYTPSSAIYIGFNPATGLVAPAGTFVNSLFIDPPNHGNG